MDDGVRLFSQELLDHAFESYIFQEVGQLRHLKTHLLTVSLEVGLALGRLHNVQVKLLSFACLASIQDAQTGEDLVQERLLFRLKLFLLLAVHDLDCALECAHLANRGLLA